MKCINKELSIYFYSDMTDRLFDNYDLLNKHSVNQTLKLLYKRSITLNAVMKHIYIVTKRTSVSYDDDYALRRIGSLLSYITIYNQTIFQMKLPYTHFKVILTMTSWKKFPMGNPPVTGGFPYKRPVMLSFEDFLGRLPRTAVA